MKILRYFINIHMCVYLFLNFHGYYKITHLPSSDDVRSMFVSSTRTVLELPRLVRKGSCLGVGGITYSPSRNVITLDIVGCFIGSCCTHKRQTFTHLITWLLLQQCSIVMSIKSNALFYVHSFQAWEDFKIQFIWGEYIMDIKDWRYLEKSLSNILHNHGG